MDNDECLRCGRTKKQLQEKDISILEDGYCLDCEVVLKKIWEVESKQAEKDWQNSRL